LTDGEASPPERALEEQAAVLDFVLTQHPTQLSLAEVVLALAAGPGFAERDAVEAAVGELVRSGLVRRQGEAVVATRPALSYRELAARWP
jgi:hypothetical protein